MRSFNYTKIYTILHHCNLMCSALLKDKRVLFAGYKVPHPLEHLIQVRVQTTDKTTPTQALQTAIESIINEISSIKLHFDDEVRRSKELTSMQGPNLYQEPDADF
ncbi:hypothetical protein HMI55_003989 [Coelomomyces lativittatus]|nr:hypothetical protein HMI55_003989 [Coelomomyces lativittatus]